MKLNKFYAGREEHHINNFIFVNLFQTFTLFYFRIKMFSCNILLQEHKIPTAEKPQIITL